MLPPLSLYVHLPWCVRKCPYCDFNSHVRDGALPEGDYLQALLQDLDQERDHAAGRTVQSIFFGGGTPSLLSPEFYDRLLIAIAQRLPLAADVEITLEANPGTVDQTRFEGYRRAGINRLSLGIQSFNDRHLRALGRIHGRAEAERAVHAAHQAGFARINLDLMHALPEQTADEALADLRTALALSPGHLSWYELTIEPNTLFWRAPPPQPDDDQRSDVEQEGFALLAAAGLERYEVSALARPGERCRHNLNYWQYGDYLGIGAGAHGKVSHDGQVWRYRKTRLPAHYLQQDGWQRRDLEPVAAGDLPFEFAMNALRLIDGVPADLYAARTGDHPRALQPAWKRLQDQGLMSRDPTRFQCTSRGIQLLNQVLMTFAGDA